MRRARQLWLNIQLWIGVALFLVFSVLGVTGSILVWDQPLERALHRDRFDVARVKPALPASAYAAAATRAFDGRASIAGILRQAVAEIEIGGFTQSEANPQIHCVNIADVDGTRPGYQ